MDQMKQLRKSREMVKLYNDRLERLQEDDGHRRSLLDRIKEKDNQLNATKAAEAQQVRRRDVAEPSTETRPKRGSKIGSLKCLQGGREHPLAACGVATLFCAPPASSMHQG